MLLSLTGNVPFCLSVRRKQCGSLKHPSFNRNIALYPTQIRDLLSPAQGQTYTWPSGTQLKGSYANFSDIQFLQLYHRLLLPLPITKSRNGKYYKHTHTPTNPPAMVSSEMLLKHTLLQKFMRTRLMEQNTVLYIFSDTCLCTIYATRKIFSAISIKEVL